MRKQHAVWLVVVLVTAGTTGQAFAQSDLPGLTRPFVTEEAFSTHMRGSMAEEIEFARNGTWESRFLGPGGAGTSGRWEFTDGELIVYVDTTRQFAPQGFGEVNRYTTVGSDVSEFQRWLYIEGPGSPRLYRRLGPVEPGTALTIQGHQVVAVEQIDASLLWNTNLRSGPGTGYDRLPTNLQDGAGGELGYLPAGWELRTLARTPQREVVGEWNDYWYYVNIHLRHDPFYEAGPPAYAWVYGALIDFE